MELKVIFSEDLSLEQIKGTLEVLCDFYRACGGTGFEISFEIEKVML